MRPPAAPPPALAPQPLACRFDGDHAPGAPRAWLLDTRLRAAPGAEPGAEPSAAPAPPEQARAHARALARAALRQRLAAALGVAPQALVLSDQRGQPPQWRWASAAVASAAPAGSLEGLHPAGAPRWRLAVAHAPGLSLIACHHGGALGVDLQAVDPATPRAELARTAHLFLGPDAARALARARGDSDAAYAQAFARAWVLHEARLKALGLGLREWTPALDAAHAAHANLRAVALRLPPLPGAPACAAALVWG